MVKKRERELVLHAQQERYLPGYTSLWKVVKKLGLNSHVRLKHLNAKQRRLCCGRLGEAWWSLELADEGNWVRRVLTGAPVELGSIKSRKEFKAAIRARSLKLHPDKPGGDNEKYAEFIEHAQALTDMLPEMVILRSVSSYSTNAFALCSDWTVDLDEYCNDMMTFLSHIKLLKCEWEKTVVGPNADLYAYEVYARAWSAALCGGLKNAMERQWPVRLKLLHPIYEKISTNKWTSYLHFFGDLDVIKEGGSGAFDAINKSFTNKLHCAQDKALLREWGDRVIAMLQHAHNRPDVHIEVFKSMFSHI
jgi:hypothetical protein